MATFNPDQLITIRKLGYPTNQAALNRLDSNGRLQQFLNTQAGLKGLKPPFQNSPLDAISQDFSLAGAFNSGPIADAISGILSIARIRNKPQQEPPPPDENSPTETAPEQKPKTGRTRPDTKSEIKGQASKVVGAETTFGSTTDFFHFIAWLFHPLNWLRMVEFLTGIFLLYMGLTAASRVFRRAAGPTPMARRAIESTPIGRASRIRKYSRGYSERAAARERISTS